MYTMSTRRWRTALDKAMDEVADAMNDADAKKRRVLAFLKRIRDGRATDEEKAHFSHVQTQRWRAHYRGTRFDHGKYLMLGGNGNGNSNSNESFPRRAAADVNRNRLDSLMDMPIEDAAREIGWTQEKLRSHAKKLGVKRWPYKHRRCVASVMERIREAKDMSNANQQQILRHLERVRRLDDVSKTELQRFKDSRIRFKMVERQGRPFDFDLMEFSPRAPARNGKRRRPSPVPSRSVASVESPWPFARTTGIDEESTLESRMHVPRWGGNSPVPPESAIRRPLDVPYHAENYASRARLRELTTPANHRVR